MAKKTKLEETRQAWLDAQPRRTCRGVQDQNLGEVLKKLDREAEAAERRADRVGEGARAKQLRTIAAGHRKLAARATEAAQLLEEAGEEVRTGRVVEALIVAGERTKGAALDSMARRRCGQPLNEAIHDHVPEDGEVHYYACPRCGMEHSARRVPVAAPAQADAE